MPIFRPFSETLHVKSDSTASNTCVSVVPVSADTGQVDDLAIWICVIDGSGTVPTAPAGWTHRTFSTYGGTQTRMYIYTKKLASGDTSAVTLTHSHASASINFMMFLPNGSYDSTTFIDSGSAAFDNGALPSLKPSCPSVTPTVANCTLLSLLAMDGNRRMQPGTGNFRPLGTIEITGITKTVSLGFGNLPTTAATSAVEFWSGGAAADDFVGVSLLIRPAATIKHSPAIPNSASVFDWVAMMSSSSGSAMATGESYRDPSLNGITTVATIGATQYNFSTGNDNLQPYLVATGIQVVNTGNPAIGYEMLFASAIDMSASQYLLGFDFTGGTVPANAPPKSSGGMVLLLRSADTAGPTRNWTAYRVHAKEAMQLANYRHFVLLEVNNAASYVVASSGTLDTSAVISATILSAQQAFAYRPYIAGMRRIKPFIIAGGCVDDPIKFSSFFECSKNLPSLGISQQGSSQTLAYWPMAIGANGQSCYFDDSAFAVTIGSQTNENAGIYGKHFGDNVLGITFNLEDLNFNPTLKAKSGSISGADAFYFKIKDYTTTPANITLDLSGLLVAGPGVTEIDFWTGQTISGMTWVGRDLFDYTVSTMAGNFRDCIFDSTPIKINSEAQLGKINDCTLRNNTGAAITITGDQTGSWSEPNLTVSNNGYDIEYTGATNFSIQSAATLTVNNSSTGVLTIVTPTFDLTLTSSQSSTLLQVFDTGTQTVITSTTGTTLSYTHSGETVDVVAQKAGFLPQRQTGIVLSGDVPISFNLVADPVYTASHGLTYTTDSSYNRTTKKLTNTTRNEARGIYSLLVDSFISEASLRNTAFPLQAIGPDLFAFVDGAEMLDAASEDKWKGAGYRYISPAGVVTKEAASFKISGVPSGATAVYQQVDGSGETAARASGNVDEVIAVYADASHGNFDRRGNMVFKTLVNGRTDGRVDIVDDLLSGGSIEPFEYVSSFSTAAMDIAAGDPALTITVTDLGASPATHFGKLFSIVITDNATQSSGEDIVRELNYNKSIAGTYQGKARFNWPQLATKIGDTIETVRGYTEGAQSSTLKGVIVLLNDGVTAHPAFSRFQADDGTYYTPAASITVSAPNLISGTRVLLWNNTTASVIENVAIGGGGYSKNLTTGVDYAINDQIILIAMYSSGGVYKYPYRGSAVLSTANVIFNDSQIDWVQANNLSVDGSTVIECSTNYAQVQVEVDDADNSTTKARIAAFICDALATEDGILNWISLSGVPVIRFTSSGSAVIDKSVADVEIDNIKNSPLNIVDAFQLRASDGTSLINNSTYSINWDNGSEAVVIETGVSGLTGPESAQLATAAGVAALIGTPSTTIAADIAAVKEDTLATFSIVNLIKQDHGLDIDEPKVITENTLGISYDETFSTVVKEIRKDGNTTTITRTA